MVLVVKNPPDSAGYIRNVGFIPGLVRSPGGGHGNPLQYSCLENPRSEEPGRVQSIGSHRVGHDGSDLACMHIHVSSIKNKKIKIFNFTITYSFSNTLPLCRSKFLTYIISLQASLVAQMIKDLPQGRRLRFARWITSLGEVNG